MSNKSEMDKQVNDCLAAIVALSDDELDSQLDNAGIDVSRIFDAVSASKAQLFDQQRSIVSDLSSKVKELEYELIELIRQQDTLLDSQHAVLNNLSEGVAVFGGDGSLIAHNTLFQRLWHLEHELLNRNQHLDDILNSLSEGVIGGMDSLADAMRFVTSESSEDCVPVKEGTLQLFDGRTIQFGIAALPDRTTLVHFREVTDSYEREKELRERNELLADIDRLKSKFLDHVSYQFRTPLSAIIGFSDMLDSQRFGVLNDRQKDYVTSILSASYHLRDLINDVIDLAAIESGKLTLEETSVDVLALLKNVATFCAVKAEDTKISLSLECPNDIGTIRADERRLQQVLFTLLSNAFAYTGTGGHITIGAHREPELVKLWVNDDGRGIPSEKQEDVFEAFVGYGSGAGAGIGLTLAKKIIDLHGGWVRLESESTGGTCVNCFLPNRLISPNMETTESVDTDESISALALTRQNLWLRDKRRRLPVKQRKARAAE